MNTNKQITIVLFTVLFLLVTIGDSQAWLFSRNKKEELVKRASQYWNSKLTGDLFTCYQLEEPSVRKKVPISQYVKTGNLIYKSVKITSVDIKKDLATVDVKIKYIIPALGSRVVFTDTVKDYWKKIDDNWFHHIKANPIGKTPKRKGGDEREAVTS